MRRLRTSCERAKRQLSQSTTAQIDIENLSSGINYLKEVTRAQFESLCKDLFVTVADTITRTLKSAHLTNDKIHKVLLVGGSAKIPHIVDLVTSTLGRKPEILDDPGTLAVTGAAYQSAMEYGPEGSFGKLPWQTRHPNSSNMLLMEISAHTIGYVSIEISSCSVTDIALRVEVANGMFEPILKRNSSIPTKRSLMFTTAIDNQTCFIIKVYEGERVRAKNNTILASLEVPISPAPRGQIKVEVVIDIAATHIATITAHVNGAAGEAPGTGFELSGDVVAWDWTNEFPDAAEVGPLVVLPPPLLTQAYTPPSPPVMPSKLSCVALMLVVLMQAAR